MDEAVVQLVFYLIRQGYYALKKLYNSWIGNQEQDQQLQRKLNARKRKRDKQRGIETSKSPEYLKDKQHKIQKQYRDQNTNKNKPQIIASQKSFWKDSWFLFFFVSINQGFVGVSSNFGVLSPTLLEPGLHFYIPYYQKITQISISPQITKINNVACGTSSGLQISFDKIQIVTQLDKSCVYQTLKQYSIHFNQIFISSNARYKMGQICSKYSLSQIYMNKFDSLDEQLGNILKKDFSKYIPGLKVVDIRITKPLLPQSVAKIYQDVQKIKGNYLLAIEHQKTLIEQIYTAQMKIIKQTQSQYEVRLIELQKQIQKKQNQYSLQMIQSSIEKDSNISSINNEFTINTQNIQALQSKFTLEFLEKHIFEAINEGIIISGSHQPTLNIEF